MPQPTFYFYDLETSGFNPKEARIMQFAGQRTDLQLKPIGEPANVFIKITPDVLPEPDAVLVTGITPQQTIADGITEADFLRFFYQEIALPDTVFVGYNTIRFDDEFMRYLHYRNFYDPYEWQYREGRSRWDMLDVVRMTRALRPDSIKWPFDTSGAPSNRLELLTAINKLEHTNAHDALSDVRAVMAVARLIYDKQTKLFDYLLNMRSKSKVAKLVKSNQPLVYTSGTYPSQHEKTTVVVMAAEHTERQGVIVYDLRYDPAEFTGMSPEQLAKIWKWRKEEDEQILPVKLLHFNRCPAIAPLGVLDNKSIQRLKLDLESIQYHYKELTKAKNFSANLQKALQIINKQRQTSFITDESRVDAQLYDGFFPDKDKITMSAVRAAEQAELTDMAEKFEDKRLKTLMPLYKARNYPESLNDGERMAWEKFRLLKLGDENKGLGRYFERLAEITERGNLTSNQQFLLEELQLYGQSLVP